MCVLKNKYYEKLNKNYRKNRWKILQGTFVKKDGTTRGMLARTGVKAHLKGGAAKYDSSRYISVYDVHAKGYRLINKETLKEVKFGGKVYR